MKSKGAWTNIRTLNNLRMVERVDGKEASKERIRAGRTREKNIKYEFFLFRYMAKQILYICIRL